MYIAKVKDDIRYSGA